MRVIDLTDERFSREGADVASVISWFGRAPWSAASAC
jgi:hypothetical protein